MAGVVGIDPSLTCTGLAHVDTDGTLAVSTVTSKALKDPTLEQINERVFAVANEVIDWVLSRQPELVVIENPSYASRFGKPHERAGLWWQVVNALLNDGYPIARVAPQTRAMYATGAGNSGKAVVLAFVRENYTDLLGKRIANDNIADAIVLADLGAHREGFPLDTGGRLSDRHYRALGGVLWPKA